MDTNKNASEFLKIAEFTKPQGLKGQLRAKLFCDNTDFFENCKAYYMGESKTPVQIGLCGARRGFAILTVEDVDSVGNAEQLVGESLYIKRSERPLPEDTWFVADLIGAKVVDADSGTVYGVVEDILQNAPKDVYVVKTPDKKQLLFPAIPEVLIEVDITERIIKIRPLAGLFDSDGDGDSEEN